MVRLGEKIKNWWSKDDYALATIFMIIVMFVAIFLLGALLNDNPCKGDESVCDCKTIYINNRNPMDVCIVKK